jgi:hypothetical protein
MVEARRRNDTDSINLAEQRFEGVETSRFELSGDRGQCVRVAVDHAHQFDILKVGEDAGVVLPEVADSDDCHA